ncbi:MAG: hypothetical protein PQJ48_04170 [Sphaerochaetaceae bacterium]|nr:hypothetical protein [Sphaerochaetaceae bacterium]
MKKTIAILLVLVIGMAGVFAVDDANLFVETTVFAINEMMITASDEEPTWTDNLQLENIGYSSSVYNDAQHTSVVDTSEAGAQTVGYLHTRTNNRLGIKVYISASALEYSIDDGQGGSTVIDTIDYTVSGGTDDYNTFDGGNAVEYMSINNTSTGLRLGDVKTVQVTLEDDAEKKTAGDYVGNIVFNYIIN